MRYLTKPEYTDIIRHLLVTEPLKEAEIKPRMKLLYAEGRRTGVISIRIAEAMPVSNNEIPLVLPIGLPGWYTFIMDQNLKVKSGPVAHISPLTNSELNCVKRCRAQYKQKVFSFEWEVSALEKDREKIKGDRIVKNHMHLSPTGLELIADSNTREFTMNHGLSWRIRQYIPDGPDEGFEQLGLRQIPEETYWHLFDSKNVIPMLSYRRPNPCDKARYSK